MKLRLHSYCWADKVELGPYVSWQDNHLRLYALGFSLFRWGLELEVFIGQGTPPWDTGDGERSGSG